MPELKIWQKYGLADTEYQAAVDQLGREPNELELAMLAVMWSEHCSYKHTRHLLKTLPTQGPLVVQGPGENAGVIDAGDGMGIAFKIESHNHPSAVEPYHGAATGVGGIVRDVFSMGARPVALLNSLRFGALADSRNRELLRDAVRGMADYGNCLGVPTVGGEVYFDNCYGLNPLVNAMCIGVAPLARLMKGVASGPGNRVLVAGARTGRDGIAGAAFASAGLDREDGDSPVVQGDPLAEKQLLEACLELAGNPDVVGIQDLGAAGLTSAGSEMAFRGGAGMELELSRVPVREQDMTPAEIMLSESQERMLLVVRPRAVAAVQEAFRRRGLQAADIGQVTAGKDLVVRMHGREVGRLPAALLTDGVPRRNPPMQEPAPAPAGEVWRQLPPPDYNRTLLQLLASANICSRRPIWQQFDYLAGGNTVQGPGTSAAVLRLPGSRKGIAAAIDCNSRYCRLDPRQGAVRAVAEAARNVACTGARPVAVTNCLNFPSPEVPEQYWALAQAIAGIKEACLALDTPVVGGNVSLYNESGDAAIYPTPVIGMVGLLEDVARACAIAPRPGQMLVMAGEIQPLPGGSEYLLSRTGDLAGPVPRVNLDLEARLCRLLPRAVAAGLVKAAHDVSDGGLAVTVAEMALAAGAGLKLSLPWPGRPDFWLFSESPGAVAVAVEPGDLAAFRELAREHGVPVAELGRVSAEPELVIGDLIRLSLAEMERAWTGTLAEVFAGA
ncbi:MAG: phosphoribosylformylglycinamidine synthase subunit PurL [Firmicutes bacterium]|nr:phosphoribosylformylglycinamidine synthase subunit PurL [Bacillota bacterium]